MLRSSFYSAGVVLLGASAFAQSNLSGQMRPITAPVKYAGVYHLGTGTWTHGTQGTAATSAAGIIYDNTCATGYYGPMPQNAIWTDEGRLPSLSSTVLPNSWGLGNDSEVGTQNSYTVDGFQIAYCTDEITARTYNIKFYEAYDACCRQPDPDRFVRGDGAPGLHGLRQPGVLDRRPRPVRRFALVRYDGGRGRHLQRSGHRSR
jgi:hypothetical protein